MTRTRISNILCFFWYGLKSNKRTVSLYVEPNEQALLFSSDFCNGLQCRGICTPTLRNEKFRALLTSISFLHFFSPLTKRVRAGTPGVTRPGVESSFSTQLCAILIASLLRPVDKQVFPFLIFVYKYEKKNCRRLCV